MRRFKLTISTYESRQQNSDSFIDLPRPLIREIFPSSVWNLENMTPAQTGFCGRQDGHPDTPLVAFPKQVSIQDNAKILSEVPRGS